LLGINAFKEQFGGRRTVRYHSLRANSTKGKLYLEARRLLARDSALPHYV
jgi:hypothetical protein